MYINFLLVTALWIASIFIKANVKLTFKLTLEFKEN